METLEDSVSWTIRALHRAELSKDARVVSREVIASFRSNKLLFQRWATAVGFCKPQSKSSKPSEVHYPQFDDGLTVMVIECILIDIEKIFTPETPHTPLWVQLYSMMASGIRLENPGKDPESSYLNQALEKLNQCILDEYIKSARLLLTAEGVRQMFTGGHLEFPPGYPDYKVAVLFFGGLVEILYDLVPPKVIGKDFKLTKSILTKQLEKLGSALPDEAVIQIMDEMV